MTGPGGKARRTALICVGAVAAMLALAYASVPLYEIFCRTTGYGGTTQAGLAAPKVVDRMIRVSFDSNVDPKLPWKFEADQPYLDVKLGEVAQVSFHARNLSTRRITGTAAYNVTPYAMGPYFNKIQCFCFNEQTLEPGQDVHMPVIFFVDPAMLEVLEARSVTQVTLSYTFFEAAGAKAQAAVASKDGAP